MLWKFKSIFNYFLRRFAQIMQLLHFPSFFCIDVNKLHHALVLHELAPILSQAFNHIKDIKYVDTHKNNKIIWTFWWQGYKEMPPLVKECFRSLMKHSNNHKIILITQYNIKKFTNIPSYMFYKLNKGCISLTHFSDILRFNLLKNYGGLWIDSTVFCTSNLTDKYFNKKIYTSGVKPDKYHFSISMGKWTGFLIGGYKHNILFIFMDYFFKLYWEKYNYNIDYFMIDYALYYAYKHNIGKFKTYVNMDIYHPHMFSLMNIMSRKYSKIIFNSLKQDTSLFKLTYKKNLVPQYNTYYYYFLNDKL